VLVVRCTYTWLFVMNISVSSEPIGLKSSETVGGGKGVNLEILWTPLYSRRSTSSLPNECLVPSNFRNGFQTTIDFSPAFQRKEWGLCATTWVLFSWWATVFAHQQPLLTDSLCSPTAFAYHQSLRNFSCFLLLFSSLFYSFFQSVLLPFPLLFLFPSFILWKAFYCWMCGMALTKTNHFPNYDYIYY